MACADTLLPSRHVRYPELFMAPKHHILVLAALVAVACTVQVQVIRRTTISGLDVVRFVGMARSIDEHGVAAVVRGQREQPLFPIWVWAVHRLGGTSLAESRTGWVESAQWAAAIPLVLAIVPLYLLIVRLIGPGAAAAASLFFCLLPEVARLGADGLSDSTHLLFFVVALWAMVEYLKGLAAQPPRWLLLAGLAVALGALARTEVLVLATAFWATLFGFQAIAGRRRPWNNLAAGAAWFALGLAVVLTPYLAAAGCRTPKTAVARLLGQYQAEETVAAELAAPLAWRLPDGEPMTFAVREPDFSTRQPGVTAAVVRFVRKLADAMGYWIGALALFGALRLRRGRPSSADRLLQIFFLLFGALAIRFSAVEGYLASRHLLTLVVAAIASAGFGTVELGRWISNVVGRVWRVAQRRGEFAWTCAIVLLSAGLCLPQTLMRFHYSRLGHRQAAEWLAQQGPTPGSVFDTLGWTGLYSGRQTYDIEQAPAALADPGLAYVVVEQRELQLPSGRSRTLRYLVETGGEPVGEFPPAASRESKHRPVLVYRWHPDRFRRLASIAPAESPTEGTRHACADRGVRR